MLTCRGFVTGLTARVFTAALASLTKALARVTGVTGVKCRAADVVTPVHIPKSTYETLPPADIVSGFLAKPTTVFKIITSHHMNHAFVGHTHTTSSLWYDRHACRDHVWFFGEAQN